MLTCFNSIDEFLLCVVTPPGQWTIPSMSINHWMKHYKYVLGFSNPADTKVTTGIQRMTMVMAPTAQLGSLFVRLIGHHAKFTLLFFCDPFDSH